MMGEDEQLWGRAMWMPRPAQNLAHSSSAAAALTGEMPWGGEMP